MKFPLIKLTIPLLCVLLLNGCISSGIIEESSHSNQVSYKLLEYKEAFIQGDTLIVNGRGGRKSRATKDYSAIFQLDAESGLPSKSPIMIELRNQEAPEDSTPVNLHYISLPIRNRTNPKESECYQDAIVDTVEPSIYINTYTKEDFPSKDACRINNFHALYVPRGTEKNRDCATITVGPYRSSKSNRTLLLALPATVVADIITLPVQAAISNSISD